MVTFATRGVAVLPEERGEIECCVTVFTISLIV